jgi:hypothetical protein
MIDKAFALLVAAIGLYMFLFPIAFMQLSYSQDYATRTRRQRRLGLMFVTLGLGAFAARQWFGFQ